MHHNNPVFLHLIFYPAHPQRDESCEFSLWFVIFSIECFRKYLFCELLCYQKIVGSDVTNSPMQVVNKYYIFFWHFQLPLTSEYQKYHCCFVS